MRKERLVALAYTDFRARSYFPVLDGIRAVAVLTVVASHVEDSHLLRGLHGARGVQWFFVLSGFLITTIALCEEEARGALAVRPFFIRRVFRILPLYILALLCFVVADVFVFRSSVETKGWSDYWPYYVTLLQDIPIKLGWANAPFDVAWSLAVEEKFYLLWPIVGFIVLRRTNRLAATSAFTSLVAVVLTVWPDTDLAKLARPYLPILLGCLAAMLVNDRRTFDRLAPQAKPRMLAVLAIVVLAPLPDTVTEARGYVVVYSVITAAAVAAFAVVNSVPALDSSTALWVGRRSYAVYLFHPLVIRVLVKLIERTPLGREAAGAVVFLLSVVLSLIIADLLHRFVERPLIVAGRRRAARQQAEPVPTEPPRV